MYRLKWIICLYVVLVWFISLPAAASAKDLFEHQNTVVPENQTTENLIVVGGDADIRGQVNDSLIVVNGDVHIRSTARVRGFVLIVGGELHQDPGSEITDDMISISFDRATLNSLVIGGGLIFGIAAVQLAGTLLMILIPPLVVLAGKQRTAALIDRYRNVPRGKLLAVGIFIGLMFAAISLLLLMTIVGIPFILIVIAAVAAALLFGLSALSLLLGEQIQGAIGKPDWIKTAVGAVLLASVVNIPFVGALIFLAIAAFSLGIAGVWTFEKLRRGRSG